jgi:hypothetical protein
MNVPGTEIKKPVCKLVGQDGNVFNLLGLAQRALRKASVPQNIISSMLAEATSGNYSNALCVIQKYVNAK